MGELASCQTKRRDSHKCSWLRFARGYRYSPRWAGSAPFNPGAGPTLGLGRAIKWGRVTQNPKGRGLGSDAGLSLLAPTSPTRPRPDLDPIYYNKTLYGSQKRNISIHTQKPIQFYRSTSVADFIAFVLYQHRLSSYAKLKGRYAYRTFVASVPEPRIRKFPRQSHWFLHL